MSSEMWNDEVVKQMDPTDIIVQYSVRLREELISSWTEKVKQRGRMVDEVIFKQELRDSFPFNKLMGMVCRDILFSAVYMEDELYENMLNKKLGLLDRIKLQEKIDEISSMLVLPIYESKAFWVEQVKDILE